MQPHGLIAEVGTLAGSDAIRANDRDRILPTVSGRAIENERGLTPPQARSA
jgi:hypothetical protein